MLFGNSLHTQRNVQGDNEATLLTHIVVTWDRVGSVRVPDPGIVAGRFPVVGRVLGRQETQVIGVCQICIRNQKQGAALEGEPKPVFVEKELLGVFIFHEHTCTGLIIAEFSRLFARQPGSLILLINSTASLGFVANSYVTVTCSRFLNVDDARLAD